MDNELKSHFDRFYHNLMFSTEIGKEEKTYKKDIYYTTKSNTLSWVNEQKINDEYIFFKTDGIILRFVYGKGYNKKYSSLEINIYKDPYYSGKRKNIKDALVLLNDYINNNYLEYDKKINKIIYGIDNTKNVNIKYKKDNIFNIDYIKRIDISDLDIIDDDIAALTKYKNLLSITTKNCNYKVKDLSKLKFKSLIDFNSTIPSINIFNNIDVDLLYLHDTKILSSDIKNGKIKTKYLKLENVNLNYELFFLLINFIQINELEINEIKLNSNEMNLLKIFYEVNSLTVSGEANSLDFLNNLKELETFYGEIKFLDTDNLNEIKKKYQKNSNYNFDKYYLHMHLDKLIKCRKFFEKIKVSLPALIKWEGIINNSNLEDIKRKILYYNNLPISIKENLFKSDNIEFIKTDLSESYKLFGIEIPENNEFETNIIGIDGYNLCMEQSFLMSRIFPIFGPNGKILEKIEYRKEQEYIIPEHKIEYKTIVNTNDDNIFDYYYNHKISNLEKYNYLKESIENDEIFVLNKEYQSLNNYNNQLIKQLEELKKQQNTINNKIWGYMCMTPRREYKIITTEENGEKYNKLIEIEDPYITKDDYNLYSIVNRHRNIKCIERILKEEFLNNNICEEEKNDIVNDIEKYIETLNEIDNIKSKIIEYILILENNINDKYKNLINHLNKNEYKNWFIDDIKKFLNNFNLDEHEIEIFTKYILLKQCYKLYKLEEELEKINDNMMKLEDTMLDYEYINYYLECKDYVEAYNKGKITLEEKNEHEKYEKYFERRIEIKKELDSYSQFRNIEYRKMIPLIDKLTNEELKNIKNSVVISNEFDSKFDKFVDYLYYYFYNDYPYWIKKELMMCPRLPEKYESIKNINDIEEQKVHVYSYKKVIKELPFD